MQVEKINLRDTQSFSDFFIAYVEESNELKQFYGLRPHLENFGEQIKKKLFSDDNRQVLFHVLNEQYDKIDQSNVVKNNLNRLQEANTYTITTGHQLNIFTGPLYFIYKIATVVDACKQLKSKYPSCHFVPVYWMATEDHDFDEIAYFNLFGKKHEWITDQKGAVGRFSNRGLDKVLEALPEKVDLFEKAYKENDTLADAVRYYVNELFGSAGVLSIDPDDARLKALFVDVIKDDLANNSTNRLVEQTNGELSTLGYQPQVFSREINFFYLQKQSRERIIQEGGVYKINNTDLIFSKDEILGELAEHPERFSPNVITRPLYQETILPNLAYVGGPAEIIYWLQLGKVFKHYQTAFPILLPRNFGLYINGASVKKTDKFGLSTADIFKTEKELKDDFLSQNTDNQVSLNGEVEDLKKVYDVLTEKAIAIDSSLKGFIGAEFAKATKGLDNIEKRLKKSEERKHETSLNQISTLKNKLFPGGGLQERHDNFLNFYINNPQFIEQLFENLDAFDMRMHVLRD